MPTFPNIDALEAYVDLYIKANGNMEITGPINNEALNGCIEFIRKSPLNWSKSAIYTGGGDISLSDEYLGVAMFLTVIPDSVSFDENFYNEYMLVNMTGTAIPLGTPTGYYTPTGTIIDNIPANSSVNLMLASNDIWVQVNSTSGGSGSTQKQPLTYKVGTTAGAPTAGELTWTLPAFLNSYVTLWINGFKAHQEDMSTGEPYITKALASDTITVSNYSGGWNTGDILDYILITP